MTAVERAVLACGGTGGHVYPAIAIARELASRREGAVVTFVGRPESFESRIVAREGFESDAVAGVGRLVGQGLSRQIRTILEMPAAIARASRVLGRRRPQVVIGTGGFVSGPAVLAAALRRIPIVLQEQNAVPGLTNRVLGALADRIALAHHPRAGSDRPGGKYRVTGNPVRPAFFDVPEYAPHEPFTLLVLGGSQGARRLNDTALDAAERLADLRGRVRLVVQSGPRWEAECRERAARSPIAVEVHAFVHDMPERLAAASLVACRSGASTIAEICAAGRPSLLVPFPFAAADHQTSNARALAATGAAEWTPESELTGETLAIRVRAAMADPAPLVALAKRARELAHPDAAARVADLAEEVAR
jgi:UDP-N-acetylglucosamine--N-acetylmuramyl-(pentapeptide) pyrophosphoryl-undecaprenol N-acetylglucosamine transferase